MHCHASRIAHDARRFRAMHPPHLPFPGYTTHPIGIYYPRIRICTTRRDILPSPRDRIQDSGGRHRSRLHARRTLTLTLTLTLTPAPALTLTPAPALTLAPPLTLTPAPPLTLALTLSPTLAPILTLALTLHPIALAITLALTFYP